MKLGAHPHLYERIVAFQQMLIAAHRAGAQLPNAMIGSEREVFLNGFLRDLFPTPYRFSSGAILDEANQVSGQLDIIVERPFAPSFPLPAGEQRLVLSDAVAAVLEVKSDLVAQWGQVEETTEKVHVLRYSPMSGGMVFGALPKRIPVIAIAYHGHQTIAGLRQRLASTADARRPEGALVLSSGAFILDMAAQPFEEIGPDGIFAFVCALNRILLSITGTMLDITKFGS